MLTGTYYKLYTYYNRQAISVQHRTKERTLIRYVQDSDFVLIGIDNTMFDSISGMQLHSLNSH